MKRVSLIIISLCTIALTCLTYGCTVDHNGWEYQEIMEYPTQQAVIKDECAEIKVYVGFTYNNKVYSLDDIAPQELTQISKLIFEYETIIDRTNKSEECLQVEEVFFTEKFVVEDYVLKQNFMIPIPLEVFNNGEGSFTVCVYGTNAEMKGKRPLGSSTIHYTKNNDVITISPKEGYLPYTFVEDVK